MLAQSGGPAVSHDLIATCLILAGIAFGCWVTQRDARKKRGNWKPYRPSTNPLRDFR